MKTARYAVLVNILSGLTSVCISAQQAAGQPPAFEVASVKRTASGGPPGDIPRNMDPSPGHLAMRNVPLRFCLEWAYDLKDYEISGPEWIKGEERYDIIANAPGPATNDQMRLMLQTLLTERFKMKFHRETREMSIYALVRGKGAPKIRAAAADAEPGLSGGAGGVSFHNQPLSRLTFLLTRRMDRPALDLTAIKGNYDYTVDISGLGNAPGSAGTEGPGPSIFTAIQNDLGLKLEGQKRPIEILVIDSVSKTPAAN